MNNRRQNSEEERLKVVLKINQAISQTLDLEKILMMACEMTTQVLKADRCSIALLSTGNTYEIVKSYKKKPSYPSIDGARFDLKDYPHIAPFLLKKRTVHISDRKKTSLSVRERTIFKQLNVKALLAVPIIVSRKTIGAIIPSRIEQSSAFSSLDLSLCQTIANQVGIAIKNAKLTKKLQEEHKELKVSQQQAYLTNERLRYLMFSTSAVIYASKTSRDYGATFITDNVRGMVGYSPEQFITNSSFWVGRIHPEDVKRILQELPIIFKKGYHTYEYRFRCKNGKYIWMRDEMKLIRDDKGQPLEIIGYWTDITDRKNTEIKMIESENRYLRLFEDSPISLWEEDFSSVKNYLNSLKSSGVKDLRAYFDNHPEAISKCAAKVKIIAVNKTTLRWYEAKSLEELKSGLNKVFTQESYEVFKEGLIAIFSGKTSFESDATNQTLKGRKIDINIRWSVLTGYERSLSRLLVSIVDITERKLTEKKLVFLANRVIEAQEEERRMTSQKLHDSIVQDLTAMKLDLKMCLRSSPQQYVQVISRLKDDEKLITQTMENLRDLSSDLRPRILDELGLFSALRWYVDKFSRRTNLEVQLKITGSKKRLSPQSEIGIFRIIQEGLTNIAKHSEAKSASLSLSAKAGYVRVVIHDNGIGFEQKRADTPTSYGLLRMMENTKLLGGKFKIISRKGKGTTLHITIPY
ncbi:MAG: PAS domain-containing protein [candidate division Zixibacteria bacterium]|nr:PAS domain-containing protein [candidate division Zixibacteria bacterium]